MKLYLIRHAESANNALWSSGGDFAPGRVADPEITSTGHIQAQLLGDHSVASGVEPRQHPFEEARHTEYCFTHLYCSLMTRSLQTANYIHQACKLKPKALLDIFERMGLYDVDEAGKHFGVEGPGRAYFEDKFPDVLLPDTLTEKGWWNRSVETDSEFFARVASSLESIIDHHSGKDDRVAMVVHGDYIDQAVNHLMEVPRKKHNYATPWVANWVTHNTSISRIDIDDRGRNVVYLNRIDHLSSPHITW